MASTLRFDNWEDTTGQIIASSLDGPLAKPGLVQVSPSAATFVTGIGSVSDSGTISFTDCTSIELDGLFSSEYTNYRVLFRSRKIGPNADNNFQFQLRSSGANQADGYHSALLQYNSIDSGVSSLGAYNRASAIISRVHYQSNITVNLDLMSPFNSSNSFVWTGSGVGGTAAINQISIIGGERGGAICDGIMFNISANTMSGKLYVYGYSE